MAPVAGGERVRTGPVRRLFSVAEVARVTGGQIERLDPAPDGGRDRTPDPAEVFLTGVEVDSRLIRQGDLFCALPGERVDGHDFVGRAFAAGALAALVSREPVLACDGRGAVGGGSGSLSGRFLVRVPESLEALGRLAAWHRRRFDLPVVGVTGSVGKTTTKDLIASTLRRRFRVLATPGNLNTDIGLPLTLFELGPEHEVACLEMGMRGPGEIERLAAIARPSVGVLTIVGPVHIELLGSVEAIARAKEELLWSLPSSGTAVLNADDERVAAMARTHRERLARVLTYGLERPADVSARSIDHEGEEGTRFEVVLAGRARELAGASGIGWFRVPLAGRHSVSNALAAVAVGLLFGMDPEDIRSGLARAEVSAMRQEVFDVGGVRVVNDAYNASPPSMAAAVALLVELRRKRGGKAVAVLGDMLELGDHSEPAHRGVGRTVAAAGIDHLVAVGPQAAAIAEEARKAGLGPGRVAWFADVPEAAEEVLRLAGPGDTVLVKASRGLRLERLVERVLAGLRERGGGGGTAEEGCLCR